MLITRKLAASVYFADFELFVLESHAYWFWRDVHLVRRPRADWARA